MRTIGSENTALRDRLKNGSFLSFFKSEKVSTFLRSAARIFATPAPVELATKTNYRSPQPDMTGKQVIVNNLTVRPINRQSQDIQKWRNAMIAAEADSDQRVLLYDLYEDILLDGHLSDAIEKRVEAITNLNLTFTVEGKQVDDVEKLTEKSFFEEFLRQVLYAKIWGHSLIELHWGAPGTDVGKTNIIPRKHVKPRLGIVTKEQWGTDGIKYREAPFDYFTIEIGKDNDLGLLLKAAQYVIYKRGDFGDWAEFAERFGMPFRWATYNNDQSRLILEQALAEAGSAGYAVAPEDAKLEYFSPGAQSGTDVFKELWIACNQEISVTILGNTETTTSSTSSGYAQSKTHQETQNQRHRSDRKFIIRLCNELLTPYLERIGYAVKGGEWSFVDEETITLSERLNIDLKVSEKVPIANKYWYEKYKIPMPEAGEEVGGIEDDEDDDTPGEAKKPQTGKKKT